VHRFVFAKAAAHAIKDLFFVNLSRGGSVSATDVVSLDFQTGDCIHAARRRQHQGVIALVTVGFLSHLVDLDHPAPDHARTISQHVFVQQIRPRIGGVVRLLSVIRDDLAVETANVRPLTSASAPRPSRFTS